ncbi:MAG: SpoIID/LytB domain-containing protein, partial [Clostridia bacterium]|nr:SpoIID/LytB domain-containing protein [Clostridia bacterium]
MADKRNTGSSRRSRAARIMCLILVILMLLGSASTVILFLFVYKTSAADYAEPVMSIGIQYGTSATGSFRTYSDTGYTVLEQAPDGERTATPLFTIADKTLIVAPHANLAYSGTGFVAASSDVAIGGYRIELARDFSDISEALTAANELSSKGYQAFPAYLAGIYKVRVGCFVSAEDAEKAKSAVSAAAGTDATVSSPSSSAVSVLTSSGEVKFEFENGTATYLGLRPAGEEDVYMRADNNYIYEGAFMYKRSGDLISVINMIGLETYIEGVLPYEISSSWHIEAQKAFSIAARSYAMGNRGKHYKSYGFDLCCTTDCQVYRGAGGVTDTVKSAVAATAGEILMYGGKVATLYYSSSTGGCTVSAKDCWGGDGAPYLTAVSTPWERYADYSNGLWTAEVSPTELCEYLRGKGYTTLTGSIASVSVESRAEGSDYVKSLKITDTSGNSVTINNTDKVRIGLSKYLKSANFNVGRGSVTYTVSKVTATTETLPY